MHLLLHPVGGRVARGYINHRRVAQKIARQLADRLGEGRREQQSLPPLGQQRQQATDRRQKAEIEHSVALVQHQNLDSGQADGFLAQVVQQPPRRGHQDVNPAAQGVELRSHADAADQQGGAGCEVVTIDAHAVGDLGGQFAGWGQHQGAWPAGRQCPVLIQLQPLQQR